MPENPNAQASQGPYSQSATMSSDFTSIRYISDDDARIIAEIRYTKGAEQDENLLNASLLAGSWKLLKSVQALLADIEAGTAIVRNEETLRSLQKAVSEATTINGN